MNIYGFRFIEIETGFVAKPNRTVINRLPFPPQQKSVIVRALIDTQSTVVNSIQGINYCSTEYWQV